MLNNPVNIEGLHGEQSRFQINPPNELTISSNGVHFSTFPGEQINNIIGDQEANKLTISFEQGSPRDEQINNIICSNPSKHPNEQINNIVHLIMLIRSGG